MVLLPIHPVWYETVVTVQAILTWIGVSYFIFLTYRVYHATARRLGIRADACNACLLSTFAVLALRHKWLVMRSIMIGIPTTSVVCQNGRPVSGFK